jgi:septal ring factor EnvC (AmiA/AmiB activator)
MARGIRAVAAGLVVVAFLLSLFVAGCTRYANDKQMTTLEESKTATNAAQDNVAKLEKENADLKAKLAAKQAELKQVQAEKEKVKSKLGQ